MRTNAIKGHHLETKEQIMEAIRYRISEIEAAEGEEAKKSVRSHNAYLEFTRKFMRRVDGTIIPEGLQDGWGYVIEITENSACLYLELTSDVEEDGSYSIHESFRLVDLRPKMLSVEDYAYLHEVNVGTVRQWIRRGKLRKAEKIGNEWRIPEFLEPITGKYVDGVFIWHDKLNGLLPEFEFINDYFEIGISQEDVDVYLVGLIGRGKRKLLRMSGKDREKLEVMLISNPDVSCLNGRMSFERFEEDDEEE